MMKWVCIYLLIINIAAFFLYGIDKYKAVKKLWRIPEATLIMFAAIGGAAGAILGMLVWHHKTRKWKFRILVPLFLVIWIGILICGFTFAGIPAAGGLESIQIV